MYFLGMWLVNSFQYFVGRSAHEHMVMTELLRAGMQLSLFGISNPNHQILGGLNIPMTFFIGMPAAVSWCAFMFFFFDCCTRVVIHFINR